MQDLECNSIYDLKRFPLDNLQFALDFYP